MDIYERTNENVRVKALRRRTRGQVRRTKLANDRLVVIHIRYASVMKLTKMIQHTHTLTHTHTLEGRRKWTDRHIN